MIRELMSILGQIGLQANAHKVREYIRKHEHEGVWINLKEDTWDGEEWIWKEPKRETFNNPIWVQVINPEPRKYQVFASPFVREDALSCCPVDDFEDLENAVSIMAAGYKSCGEVEEIRLIVE